MDTLRLRPAEFKDIEAIVRLVNLAFLSERPFIEGERVESAGVHELLAKGTFVLAEQEGALVACVFVNPQEQRAHIGLVSVDPDRQGQGLGFQLMSSVEEHCRAAGYQEMELRFINHRTELLRFYKRLGYAETGVTELLPDQKRVKVPFHFVQMIKSLT
jgi:GNAT superfamily N-acetyltransferase